MRDLARNTRAPPIPFCAVLADAKNRNGAIRCRVNYQNLLAFVHIYIYNKMLMFSKLEFDR